MVRIGDMHIGGKEGIPGEEDRYPSGVAFHLSKKSPVDETYEFASGIWTVEIKKNNQHIVARSREAFPENEILREGFDSCQKFLDLVSVNKKITLGIDHPDREYILVFNKNDRITGRIVTNADLGISVEATCTIKDKEGNVVEQPPDPQRSWIPAFRYYRISQSETDLYDAYRNLYLAFESLLQYIIPIQTGERETAWLLRALNEVGKNVSLRETVPEGKDPIPYISGVYYEHYRCKTFHAKNRDYILPHEWADAEKLSEAYEGLLRIWRAISVAYNLIPGGGGVVTYQGFMGMMDAMANQGFLMHFTDDPSPEDKDDTRVSPRGHPVYSTKENIYVRDFHPGIVLCKSTLENPEQTGLVLIHRFCLTFGDVLFSEAYYEDGIYPAGIDILEGHETFRLINKSSPKTIF